MRILEPAPALRKLMVLLAALASFAFPGTGQMLTGAWLPTLAWAVTQLVALVAAAFYPQAAFVAIALRIGSALDAAVRVRRDKPGTEFTSLAAIIAISSVLQLVLLRRYVIEGFRVPGSSMAPTLVVGDHVFCDKLSDLERGDVVLFRHPLDLTYVKRLIALGGDTVAVRAGVLYVNGAAVPRTRVGETTYYDVVELDGEAPRRDERAVDEWIETYAGHTYHVYMAPPEMQRPEPDFPRADRPCDGATADQPAMRGTLPVHYAQPAMTATADGTACVVPRGHAFFLGDNRDNSNDSRFWGVIPTDELIGRASGIWFSNDPAGAHIERIGRIE
jgi:signal peptidase I